MKIKAVYYLALLRDARSLILRDAESFHEAATVLETIGKIAGGKLRRGLGEYKEELLEICLGSGPSARTRAARLIDVVCMRCNGFLDRFWFS